MYFPKGFFRLTVLEVAGRRNCRIKTVIDEVLTNDLCQWMRERACVCIYSHRIEKESKINRYSFILEGYG